MLRHGSPHNLHNLAIEVAFETDCFDQSSLNLASSFSSVALTIDLCHVAAILCPASLIERTRLAGLRRVFLAFQSMP